MAGGRRMPIAKTTFSSPLAFDFTEPLVVKLINGSDVPNQRYLFLVF
jgi:hypothetical protein